MSAYFRALKAQADSCYEVAAVARAKGFDPELEVEIPRADDLASRVEKLLGLHGVAELIREVSREHEREEMSLLVAKSVAKEMRGSLDMALDKAVRVGLAVLTEGILVAPLDGIAEVRVNGRGKDSYASISFAGPVRSAGGTGQAMSVLITDVVRRELGIGAYRATPQEVERWKEEIPLYRTTQHLQYLPTDLEVALAISGCPVCVDGEGTEDVEISGYRDLPRIGTNRVRGGACLVVAEGLCQKASKLKTHKDRLGIDGWEFVDKLVERKQGYEEEGKNGVEPSVKFIKDVVAGRPVYSHPSRKGGFRLRYGRARTGGLASICVHPATMHILESTMAVGTQIKIERPGKAGISTPCDLLEGPLVRLHNRDLVRIRSINEAIDLKADDIVEVVELGELLIPMGEFLENNHPLVPGVFDIGWYIEELRDAGVKDPEEYEHTDLKKAIRLSKDKAVPLHPDFTFMWNNLDIGEVTRLRALVAELGTVEDGELHTSDNDELRALLVELGAPHRLQKDDTLLVENGLAMVACLGLKVDGKAITPKKNVPRPKKGADTLSYVSKLAGFSLGDRRGTLIGARMARPEKADMRKMNPPVHCLFPVGTAGGPQRLFDKAEERRASTRKIELGVRRCPDCGRDCFLPLCKCGGHTLATDIIRDQPLDFHELMSSARNRLGIGNMGKVKGVQGMISKRKTPEMPEKGMLRSKHSVYVFKDGTCRFDCTDAPLTHFRPREIGTSVKRLKELGYTKDMDDNVLKSEDQLLELKVQDIILPENGGDYLCQVAGFVDELLTGLYDMEPYYNARSRDDLIGSSLLGLSPHTSGGVLCRLIGFTRASVSYAHPYFHAAKRRNCDGDEDCYMLLLDGLLNFSVSYLPEKRGGRMDAPLLLMMRIDPNEIDKEAHNIDVMDHYPIEFYRAALMNADPRTIDEIIDTVRKRIGTVLQYERFGFTMDTGDIAAGPTVSSYKTLGSMEEKTRVQLDLAKKIRAVDERDVAERLINNHFLPDMMGNLKKFSSQQLRCTKCGKKYRRMPLAGGCECGNRLILTVHEGSVRKYLEMSKAIAKEFGVSAYTSQRIDMMEEAMDSLFQNQRVRNTCLIDFID
jgi:DNA polymerase II large subunit